MNKEVVRDNPAPTAAMLSGLSLGRQIGNRQAFALIAGRSSAADIEIVRHIREEKSYRELGCTWEEFCTLHLQVSRRSVDRAIGYLEEFGPAFFHVTQLAHIGPTEYRAIARFVDPQGIHADGHVIALLPENSQQLSTAIAGLLRGVEEKEPGPAAPSFNTTLKRCLALSPALRSLPGNLDRQQKESLERALVQIRSAAFALGIELF